MRSAIPASAVRRRRMVARGVRVMVHRLGVMVHRMRVLEVRWVVHERMRMHKVWWMMEGRHLFLSGSLLFKLFLLLFFLLVRLLFLVHHGNNDRGWGVLRIDDLQEGMRVISMLLTLGAVVEVAAN